MSVVLIPARTQKIQDADPTDVTISTENVTPTSTPKRRARYGDHVQKKYIPIDDPIPKDAVIMQEYVPGSDVHKLVLMASGALESIQWYQEQLSERFSSVVGVWTNSQRARVAREKDIATVKKFRDSEKIEAKIHHRAEEEKG